MRLRATALARRVPALERKEPPLVTKAPVLPKDAPEVTLRRDERGRPLEAPTGVEPLAHEPGHIAPLGAPTVRLPRAPEVPAPVAAALGPLIGKG